MAPKDPGPFLLEVEERLKEEFILGVDVDFRCRDFEERFRVPIRPEGDGVRYLFFRGAEKNECPSKEEGFVIEKLNVSARNDKSEFFRVVVEIAFNKDGEVDCRRVPNFFPVVLAVEGVEIVPDFVFDDFVSR